MVMNDTISVRLRSCKDHCYQLWLANAIFPNHTLPVESYPRATMTDLAKADSSKSGRILCWVMTNPPNHATKGVTGSLPLANA